MEPPIQALVTRLKECLEPRGEILEAYLFGSAARGSAQAHSDIDVAVYAVEPRPETSPYGYAAELGTTLMSALGTSRVDMTVDLARVHALLNTRLDGFVEFARHVQRFVDRA